MHVVAPAGTAMCPALPYSFLLPTFTTLGSRSQAEPTPGLWSPNSANNGLGYPLVMGGGGAWKHGRIVLGLPMM
jgi:hypothetical protein